MLTSWMTTIPGIIQLLIVAWTAWQTKTIDAETLRQALVGIGFIAAKDFNVVGGSRS